MAFNLTITDQNLGFNFNCKYEKMDRLTKPDVVAKAPNGKVAKLRTVYQGQILGPGSTQRQWCDEDGNQYAKAEISFEYEGEPALEVSQTKIFKIQGYQDLSNYSNAYIIDKFYEVFPSDNGMKKDIDKQVAVRTNLSGMRKLWEHLIKESKLARGEFCPSSRGFVYSDAFIRAVEFGNKWGLEIGVFKEEKIFHHLNEGVPTQVSTPTQQPRKKLKMV
jgi:hypothetical protein